MALFSSIFDASRSRGLERASGGWLMKQFYETYKDSEKLSSLLRELPWSGNLVIMARAKTNEEKDWELSFGFRIAFTNCR